MMECVGKVNGCWMMRNVERGENRTWVMELVGFAVHQEVTLVHRMLA